MTHKFMPKIFHGPHKKPPAPPSYILNVPSLIIKYIGLIKTKKNAKKTRLQP